MVLFSAGRRKPEYIPGSLRSDAFEVHPTGIIGYQDNHFVWYRYDWKAEVPNGFGDADLAGNPAKPKRGGALRRRRARRCRRGRKGLKQKERNRLTHALNGNTKRTNLERAWTLATRLNVNNRPHPHQADVAIGAEAPDKNVLPPEEWLTKILPMVLVAEINDVGRALKVNLRGDILGIVAHTGNRTGTFYGVRGGTMGDAVYDNWEDTRKNSWRVPRVKIMKFAGEREARAFAGLPNRDFVRVAARIHSPLNGARGGDTVAVDVASHVWERDVMKHYDAKPDGEAMEVIFFGVQRGEGGDWAALKVAGEPAVDDAVLPTKGWRSAFGERAGRRAGVSLYAGTGGMEAVLEDVGVPTAVACDNDKAVLRNRRRKERCLELEITNLGEWHRILDALDDFAKAMGWSDWGSLVLHMGLPCQQWSTAFTDPPGLSDARGWHFVHMLRAMVWLQPVEVLVETGEAIIGVHVAVW